MTGLPLKSLFPRAVDILARTLSVNTIRRFFLGAGACSSAGSCLPCSVCSVQVAYHPGDISNNLPLFGKVETLRFPGPAVFFCLISSILFYTALAVAAAAHPSLCASGSRGASSGDCWCWE